MSEPAVPRDAHPVALARGRFAPSPTGPLHFGSLIAALASFLDARSRGGEWLVRIEDLDPLREVSGAAGEILRALEAFGLEWDGAVMYQSGRHELYAAALERLIARGLAYPCACTRREIADSALHGIDGPVYPGTCREGIVAGRAGRVWRVRVGDMRIELADELQGTVSQALAREVGDFVLRRADGLFAYQLAVVVDDAEQGITRVVRGADLIDSTQRQIMLQGLLGLPSPAYLHVPVAVNSAGDKLSKQTLARALDMRAPGATLIAALCFLGQSPPQLLRHATPREIVYWARTHWRPAAITRRRFAPAPADFI